MPASADGLATGLHRLLGSEPQQREELGRNLQRLVCERYTWAHLAQRLVELYRNLIDPDVDDARCQSG